jgi:CubicO group peptidase (beta-lactamase class C family)
VGVRVRVLGGVVAACLLAAPAAHARECPEPAGDWERAAPADVGMDAERLQRALDRGTSDLGFAVRVYRRGCLVGEDRGAAANRTQEYESWSMAKSVTALVVMRAMTLGLISPEDPVGSLVPEADREHGAITVRDLLTMTSGLRWNGLRDYNIFTMPDRVRDALTLEPVRRPGTYFEYAQSAVTLLAEATTRAVGEDFEAFAQRELMTPLGIPDERWRWVRDQAGHVEGFRGVLMRPDDFGRLGELMRRGGTWRGRRLLGEAFARQAVTPTRTNGCYGWLIWVNAGEPCVGPTISERPVTEGRQFPDLPADLYRFSGLFGQLVTVFPSQELVVVRTGQDRGLVFAGGTNWERELYRLVLASITDEQVPVPGPAPPGPEQQNADYGFQTSLREPDQFRQGAVQAPLPPAGPQRARASEVQLARHFVSRAGTVALRVLCPARWPGRTDAPRCAGTVTLAGGRAPVRYDAPAGRMALVRVTLDRAVLKRLSRRRAFTLTAVTRNDDAAAGTPNAASLQVVRPRPTARRRARR